MGSIGIDLGTTNSVASQIVRGQPEIIQYRGEKEEWKTLFPSVVGLSSDQRFLVGYPAVRNAALAARDTVFSIKRLMGLNYDADRVQELKKRAPYEICAAEDADDLGVRVMIGQRRYSPIEISTMILKRLAQLCSEQVGPIDHVTITVPALFQDSQRNATVEAGKAAGFKLRPLLDEPNAAALAFGFGREKGSHQRLLVYDLGGGTFDVSIVQIAGDNLQVLDQEGDMWLGGDDFDDVLIKHLQLWLADKYGITDFNDPQLRRILKTEAEKAKIALSDAETCTITEPAVASIDGRSVDLDLTIRRDWFDREIGHLVDRSMEMVETLLERNSIDADQLTNVLLVGGSTLVPQIRQRLRARFGEEKVRTDVNPMHCVSLGAALWNERFPKSKITLGSRTGLITPMDYGIEIYYNGNPNHFSTIIPRQEPYPTEPGKYREPFKPTVHNQRKFRIPIFQGNHKVTTFNSCQGIFRYESDVGVPLNSTVFVAFNIDMHGKLTMEVDIDGRSETRKQYELERNRSVVDESEQERLSHWREELSRLIQLAEHFREEYQEYLESEDDRDLAALIVEAKTILNENRREEWQSIKNRLLLAIFGSGTASTLFKALRAQEMADKASALVIGRARRALMRAYKEEDADQVQKISDELKVASNAVLSSSGDENASGPTEEALTK